jgi:hypothetical protein
MMMKILARQKSERGSTFIERGEKQLSKQGKNDRSITKARKIKRRSFPHKILNGIPATKMSGNSTKTIYRVQYTMQQIYEKSGSVNLLFIYFKVTI